MTIVDIIATGKLTQSASTPSQSRSPTATPSRIG